MTTDALTTRATAIRIGCAGWSIPSRHAQLFGDGASHLARYATRFDVTEINSTFHRPHQPRTFERWAASVLDNTAHGHAMADAARLQDFVGSR